MKNWIIPELDKQKIRELQALYGLPVFTCMLLTIRGITTKEEIDLEMVKFTQRLRDCIERYGLKDTPMRMKELDDVKSELTTFNYSNLYYFE